MATVTTIARQAAPAGMPDAEWAARCALAAAYRLAALYGWTDLKNKHIPPLQRGPAGPR